MIQESNADVRITVIVNPSTDANDVDSTADINQIALAALNSLPVEKAMRFIRNIVKEDVANVIVSGKQFDIEVIMFDWERILHAGKRERSIGSINKVF